VGTIQHEAVVIVSHDEGAGFAALLAFADSLPDDVRHLFVGPTRMTNIYAGWVWMPDGSKEGWARSDECDEWRDKLMALCRTNHIDFVHVALDGDIYEEPRILAWSEDDTA
jgi:hypothetical protein